MIALFFNILLSLSVLVLASLALLAFATRILPKGLFVVWTWPGTAIHELSHAAACIPALAKIKSITLFRADGSGEVVHSEPRLKLVGIILISLAPIVGGLLMIAFLNWILGNPLQYSKDGVDYSQQWSFLWHALLAALGDLWGMLSWERLVSWQFWLMLFMGLSISLRMVPSGQDFKNCAVGLGIVLGLLFFWLLVTSAAGQSDLGASAACGWLLLHFHVILAFFLLDALILGSLGALGLFIGG